jgi:hypothetical protein
MGLATIDCSVNASDALKLTRLSLSAQRTFLFQRAPSEKGRWQQAQGWVESATLVKLSLPLAPRAPLTFQPPPPHATVQKRRRFSLPTIFRP